MLKRILLFFVIFLALVSAADCENEMSKIEAVQLFFKLGPQNVKKMAEAMKEGKKALSSGYYAKSLEKMEEALEIIRKTENKKLISGILTVLGSVNGLAGNFDKGLMYSQKALNMCRDIGYKLGESANLTGISLIYSSLGQYDKALEYSSKALEADRESGEPRGESSSLANIGLIYWHMGEYDKSLSFSEKALAINREIGEQSAIGRNLMNIGVAYLKLEQYEKSISYLNEALSIHKKENDRMEEAYTLANLGIVYEKIGKYQEASESLNRSIAISQKTGIHDLLWNVQSGLAKTEGKLGNSNRAVLLYEEAIDSIEAMRQGIASKEAKLSFMQNKFIVYDEFIALLQSLHSKHPDKGYDKKSFEIFERRQGRMFLEEMGKSGARNFSGIPETIVNEENELHTRYAVLQSERMKEESKAEKEQDTKRILSLEEQMEAVKAEEKKLQEKIKTEYPDYFALKYPKPAALKEIREEVLEPGEVMLVYCVMKEKTCLWVIGKNDFGLYPVEITEADLVGKIRSFRKEAEELVGAIAGKSSRLERIARRCTRQMTGKGHDLFELLIPEKIHTILSKAITVYVVPTGELYGLPFEALVSRIDKSGAPEYLIELNSHLSVAYLSSASLLKIIREARERKKETAAHPLIAFANPLYSEAHSAIAAPEKTKPLKTVRRDSYLQLMGGGFQALPGTENEVREIMTALKAPENPPPLQLGSAASRSNVIAFNKKGVLDHFKFVVFACHGLLPGETDRITQPALLLSHPDPQTKEDGYLTMGDVFGLKLNADLVTLSACNTGRGKILKGEGVRGLTRAFMFAGTPAVSVTLWSVESESAAKLTASMYRGIRDGKSRARALRDAKHQMVRGENTLFSNPFFWSPIVIFGDGK